MADVTRARPKPRSFPDQRLNLAFGFQTDAMASPATFKSLNLSHWLPVKSGHGLHRAPRQSMLPLPELLNLGSMTLRADFRARQPGIANIGHGIVPVAMAGGTADVIGAVLAQLPVHHDTGSNTHVAFSA